MNGLNRDEIIKAAQEVSGVEFPASMDGVKIGMSLEHLERFANLVAAAEREACAKILDDMAAKDRLSNYFQVAAIAIRARGKNAA